jgi:ribosomal protein S9
MLQLPATEWHNAETESPLFYYRHTCDLILEVIMAKHKKMPMKNGKPAFMAKNSSKKADAKKKVNGGGLSAAQKKLPPALQKAILAKKKKK